MTDAPQTDNHEEDHDMTVGQLMEHLKKFPPDSPVLVLAKMPIDDEDEDNKGKSEEELEEENTIEVPISGIEEIEYEGDDAVKAVGLFIDIGEFMDDEDEEEEMVDDED